MHVTGRRQGSKVAARIALPYAGPPPLSRIGSGDKSDAISQIPEAIVQVLIAVPVLPAIVVSWAAGLSLRVAGHTSLTTRGTDVRSPTRKRACSTPPAIGAGTGAR